MIFDSQYNNSIEEYAFQNAICTLSAILFKPQSIPLQAVCCDDHIHCCPNGYQCNKSQCVKGPHEHPLLSLVDYKTSDVIPWVAKIPALDDDEVTENSVKCSGTAQCPDNTTCCKDSTGEYRCCPLLEVSFWTENSWKWYFWFAVLSHWWRRGANET